MPRFYRGYKKKPPISHLECYMQRYFGQSDVLWLFLVVTIKFGEKLRYPTIWIIQDSSQIKEEKNEGAAKWTELRHENYKLNNM